MRSRTTKASAAVTCFALVSCSDAPEASNPSYARTIIGFSTEGFTANTPLKHVTIRVIHGAETRTANVELPTQKTELEVLGDGSVRVEIEGYASASKTPSDLLWTARASAPLDRKPGDARLLRMSFDPLCIAKDANSVLRCAEEETCALGVCIPMRRSSLELEPYAPDWFVTKADPCRGSSAPSLEIGEAISAYRTLPDDASLALEPGNQGGHHLWLGVRSTGFAQKGSLVLVSGRNLLSGAEAATAAFVFSLDQVDGGRCEVTRLRYQVDAGGRDHNAFRGAPFEIRVEMRDRFGTTASGTKRVQIE